MQETKFNIWSPVDNKDMLSRLFWIVGSLVSLLLLMVSLCVENAILSLLDGLLPTVIILYGLIKRKKFPIYYYTTCLSGLYPIIWLIIIDDRDYSKEVLGATNPPLVVNISLLVFAVVLLVFFRFGIFPRGISVRKETVDKVSVLLKLDKVILGLSVFAILCAQFLNLNIVCDKSYKTEWVYFQDLEYFKSSADVFYTKSNSDIRYQIQTRNYNPVHTDNWLFIDENGNEVFQIEYGNGALGIPWRRIVVNK